ncbi:acyl-CoA dehydrogenase family protein [Streptomyces sp. NPDC086554]|uniref:acyl-CoA dehydrogenase family protein n=1 Tax=Streptomyces sp. NPDC086554 TaxID=3154864 RepID=UPI00343AD75C
MDFDLTEKQRKRFDDILGEVRTRLGSSNTPDGQHFTRAQWKTAADIGLTGLCLPTECGGGGLGALDTALCLEAFGQGCPETGLVFGVSAHLLACAVPVRDHAQVEVRGELLTGMASGDLIAANAMTEDEAGSDVGNLAVTARRTGDDYLLHGDKSFASNAPLADLFVTYAVTAPKAGFLGVSAFAVPAELPGAEAGPLFDKMGLAGCPAGRVSFRDCHVPAEYRLGAEGQGSAIFQQSMGWERACLFGGYLGMMNRQLDECVQRADGRRQFGRRIAEFQAVSHRIAGMKQRLESARLLLYRACWLMDQERDYTSAVALSKLAVSEAAVANSLDAIQIFGGEGYLRHAGIERQLRDSVPTTLFSGTSEIQKELIARELGL